MSNRQSIHIALLLWGCVFCLLTTFGTYICRDMNPKKKKYMLFMQVSGAILLGSDAAAWGFRGVPGNGARYVVEISNFLVFLFSDLLLLLYHGYICSWIFEDSPDEERKNRRVKAVSIICISAVVLLVISQFNHMYYYIDQQNCYHRNRAYIISMILPAAGMVMDLSLLIQYRKNLSRTIFTGLLSYIVLPMIATVFQSFHYGISLINISVTVSIVMMFLEIMIEQGQTVARQEHQLAEKDRMLARQERELTESRITSMLSQIRNHFIFNTLSVISGYCKIDPEKADQALARFARYLRRNMHYLETEEMILFETELAQIEDYVALEQMRFDDLVEFGEDLEVTDFHVPPLTVQPLVENAIKHGLTKPGRKGTVCILTRKEKDAIIIAVVDDGVGFSTDELQKKDSIGIRNIRYRLEHMAHATLTIKSRPGEGTRAEIRIPCDKKEEL